MTDIGYTLASLLARRLPRGVSDRVADSLADVYVLTHPVRARAVDSNLAWIWSESRRYTPTPRARDTYRAFGRAVRDFLAHDPEHAKEAPPVRLARGSEEALAAARANGRGAMLVSGHFGPWELALQWLSSELGGVAALAARHRFRAVERFFEARRAAFGVRTLCASRPVAAALQSLEAGGWIAALADRPRGGRASGHGTGNGTRDGAGGGIVRLDLGPLLLARRSGAIVLPGVSRLTPDGVIEVRLETPFSLDRDRGGLELPEAAALLQRLFDDHVRAYPTQWFEWRAERQGALRA
jgi:KDO2-lipid IV(A) lauroyltransferase